MNVKSSVIIEIIKDPRVYRMEIPAGSAYQEAIEVAGLFADALKEMQQQSAEREKAAQEEAAQKTEA
jgi:hypothetical protein